MPQRFALRPLRRVRSIGRSGVFLAAVAMALLLCVLAWLQYHWVGQLSSDERDRMRASLNTQADAFADDFNRELTRVFFGLQIGTELPRDGALPSEVDRFEHWFATATRPDLVRVLYQVDVGDRGSLTLRRFHRTPARLVAAEWPAELAPIRARLAEQLATPQPAQPVRFPPVWPEIPALAMPRVHVEVSPLRMTAVSIGPGSGYTIAVLDRAVLQREVIPTLVERHFGTRDQSSLFVGIIGPSGPVYTFPHDTSIPAPAALLSSPDVQEGLFEIRFFEFNRFVERRRGDGPGGTPPLPPPPNMMFRGGPAGATVSILREERGRVVFRGGQGPQNGPSPWRIHLLHRAGSLEAAVAHARLRNLLVSFGVLLLLGASIGMVLISTGRARRLAAQQMEFVAGVSHELRTPLAVIRSAAENLADGIVAEPKQVRKYGDVIASEGRRLTQMVEQIMDFAGFESGRATLDLRPADVGGIVEDALRAAAPSVREHAGAIEQTMPPSLPLVFVDPGAVSRSLHNLIINALKYGGSPPQVSLSASLDGSHVRLTVRDNGAGISARDLPHIFEPFYRGANATAQQIHGSGLGLSLVKRVMDEVGGQVSVDTEPGKGSAFTLHLPLSPEAEPAPTASAAAVPAQHA